MTIFCLRSSWGWSTAQIRESSSFDGEQAIETARVRAATNLKLPDSAIIAAARTQHAIGIVGADRQWRGRELGVPFYYLPDMLEAERG